jgi:hypothetical protein
MNDNIFRMLYYHRFSNDGIIAECKTRHITWEYILKTTEYEKYKNPISTEALRPSLNEKLEVESSINIDVDNIKISSWLYKEVPYFYGKVKNLEYNVKRNIYKAIQLFPDYLSGKIKPHEYRDVKKDPLYYRGDIEEMDNGADYCHTPKYEKPNRHNKYADPFLRIRNNDILGLNIYNTRVEDTKVLVEYLKVGPNISYNFTSVITLNYTIISYLLSDNFTFDYNILVDLAKYYLYKKEYATLKQYIESIDESSLIIMLSLNIDYMLPIPIAYDAYIHDYKNNSTYIDGVSPFDKKDGKNYEYEQYKEYFDRTSKNRNLLIFCYELIPEIKSLVRKERKKNK